MCGTLVSKLGAGPPAPAGPWGRSAAMLAPPLQADFDPAQRLCLARAQLTARTTLPPSNSWCRALTLRLANPRDPLHSAPMSCPEKAGQTTEERHPREHRADDPAHELGCGSLPRDRGKPVGTEPLTVRGVDRVQRLDDRGNGQASCSRGEHPACDDPRARGHTYRTQAGTIRCRAKSGSVSRDRAVKSTDPLASFKAGGAPLDA